MEDDGDRCPYRRPFADDFSECVAYQPVQYIPLDLRHRPLPAVWTCGHLESARGERGGYYARCRLGEAPDRARWAAAIREDRLERWRAQARDFGVALAEPLSELYAAKARQVEAATADARGRAQADEALRAAANRFLEADFAMLDARAGELDRIGFPSEPLKLVTRAAIEDLTRRASVEAGWTPPAHLLEPFPDETREFLASLFIGPTVGDGRL